MGMGITTSVLTGIKMIQWETAGMRITDLATIPNVFNSNYCCKQNKQQQPMLILFIYSSITCSHWTRVYHMILNILPFFILTLSNLWGHNFPTNTLYRLLFSGQITYCYFVDGVNTGYRGSDCENNIKTELNSHHHINVTASMFLLPAHCTRSFSVHHIPRLRAVRFIDVEIPRYSSDDNVRYLTNRGNFSLPVDSTKDSKTKCSLCTHYCILFLTSLIYDLLIYAKSLRSFGGRA